MTPLFAIHLVILFSIFYIPFLPQKYLQYGIYFPSLLALGWLVLGACPISVHQPELEGKGFVYYILKRIFPSVTEKQSDAFITLVLCSVTLFACIKLKK